MVGLWIVGRRLTLAAFACRILQLAAMLSCMTISQTETVRICSTLGAEMRK
jgi:hypothetical protein